MIGRRSAMCFLALIAVSSAANAQESMGGGGGSVVMPVYTYYRYFTVNPASPEAALVASDQVIAEITPVMPDGSMFTFFAFFDGPKPVDPTMQVTSGQDTGVIGPIINPFPGQTPGHPAVGPSDPRFPVGLRDFLNGGLRKAAPVSTGVYEWFFGPWF